MTEERKLLLACRIAGTYLKRTANGAPVDLDRENLLKLLDDIKKGLSGDDTQTPDLNVEAAAEFAIAISPAVAPGVAIAKALQALKPDMPF